VWLLKAKSRETGLKKGLRGAAASIGFAAPPFFLMFLSFRVSDNGLLLGSLLLGFPSNHPPFSAYTEISIYL
jgi:hypothetical protein